MINSRLITLGVVAAATLLTLPGCGRIGIDRRDEHGMTALMRAARAGDRSEVARLLRRGAGVNAKVPTRDLREFIAFISWMQQLPESDIGFTALHYAARGRHTTVAELLLGMGADVSSPDRGGTTPLDLAIHTSDTAMIRLLLDAGARPGPRQLALAVARASPSTVELLLAGGADPDVAPEARLGRFGEPRPAPIIQAVERGDTSVVKLLLAAGADPGVRDRNGWTALRVAQEAASRPQTVRLVELLTGAGASDAAGALAKELFDAVHAGDAGRVREALGAGANPNARDRRGVPPLIHAAAHAQAEVVEALVQGGANVNVSPEHDTTPLNAAVRGGSVEAVETLLAAGARVDQPDGLGQTPLQMAASWSRTEIAALFLASSARVDPRALALAALSGDAEQVRLLLARGTDPNVNNGHALDEAARACQRRDNLPVIRALLEGGANPGLPGLSALRRAAALCTPEVVSLLVERGANPNAPDKLNASTPLMSAAASGRLDNVKVLLAAGADANARDEAGRSVLGYASGSPAVQQELRRAGARP